MASSDSINIFKNQYFWKNYAAYSNAALVVTQQHYCKQHVDHEVLKY